MKDKWSKKELAILDIMKSRDHPVSSPEIMNLLHTGNFKISERTVRYYLDDLCKRGEVEKAEEKGFRLTKKGLNEIATRMVITKVGFLSAKINSMSCLMTFDPDKMTGTVVVNVSVVDPRQILNLIPLFMKVFEQDLAMGERIIVYPPESKIGELTIPVDRIGIGTVCSITLNGVLLKAGVPVNSRFGGVLQIEENQPVGFVDIIMYDGTSIDPLEIFISSGMTDYLGAIRSGRGRVGASFRELPAEALEIVYNVNRKMKKAELGGFSLLSSPGRALLQVPVNEGCVGGIIMGGLNPVAVFQESGVCVYSRALSGLVDYDQLFHFSDFENRLKKMQAGF